MLSFIIISFWLERSTCFLPELRFYQYEFFESSASFFRSSACFRKYLNLYNLLFTILGREIEDASAVILISSDSDDGNDHESDVLDSKTYCIR